MVQYLMRRILTGWHSTVHYSFLDVGHTKFVPHLSLGSFSIYSTHKGGSIDEMVVNQSAVCYVAQVVCHEDGSIIASMYKWSTLLASHFKMVVGIKKIHLFRMLCSTPGVVYVKEHTDTEEVLLSFPKDYWQHDSASLPPWLEPGCLSDERKWHLYEHIRLFCLDNRRMFVHAQLYQIQEMAAHLY